MRGRVLASFPVNGKWINQSRPSRAYRIKSPSTRHYTCAFVLLLTSIGPSLKFWSVLIIILYAYKIEDEALTWRILRILTIIYAAQEMRLVLSTDITNGYDLKVTRAIASFEVSYGALQFHYCSGA